MLIPTEGLFHHWKINGEPLVNHFSGPAEYVFQADVNFVETARPISTAARRLFPSARFGRDVAIHAVSQIGQTPVHAGEACHSILDALNPLRQFRKLVAASN